MQSRPQFGDDANAVIEAVRKCGDRLSLGGVFHTECFTPRKLISVPGRPARMALRWEDISGNLVTNEGLAHILDVLFAGSTQVNPWYVGLLAASPTPGASWTATEIGSNDFVTYDEAALQEYVDVHAAASSTNAASKAAFTISSDAQSIGGAFLISTSAKGTPAGTVLCAVAFTGGNKAADSADVLNVTYTFTAADDGA